MSTLKKILAGFALLLLTNIAFAASAAKAPRVEMKTSEGAIVIELNAEKAPISAANFLQYVRDGFYDGLIFHRVIKGFMIQGGAHFPNMSMKPPRDPIVNEAKNGLKNEAGTIAMARTSDPNSASSQFFINLVDNPDLDYESTERPGYAVFGKVVSGIEIVQKIGGAKTGYAGYTPNVPKTPIIIESTKVLTAKP
jgi:cyclophilin family peptidyl-prolyl cis-trans isomerase